MKNFIYLFIAISFLSSAFAQDRKSFDEAFEELDDSEFEFKEGKLTLRFFNALTGKPIENAKVEILDENLTTDPEGKVTFDIPEDGNYNAKFVKIGFISSNFKIAVEAQTLFFNRFSVSPKLEFGHLRVVLDWGEKPKDLDANLVKKNDYHVSYRKMKASKDGTAKLDRDDRNSYGPETITVKEISDNSTYSYFVHNYSNRSNKHSDELSKSKASVKVYGENSLLRTFNIPQKQKGNFWEVFRIENGQIITINEIQKRN